jgi:proline dehydrogenase
VRLVSGNTEESPAVAFTRPQDIDANYRKLLFNLLESGTHVSIATHDVKMIQVAKMFVKQHGIAMEQFEFEMLYGMARELPPKLAKEGYTVRVSVPFGAAWYPYFTDRLADNPDNTGLIGSLFKG